MRINLSAGASAARVATLAALNRLNVVLLDYPVRPRPRYGHGEAPHPELCSILAAHREAYADVLRGMLGYADRLAVIPTDADPSSIEPRWHNRFAGGLDAISLYCFVAMRAPGRFFEIGSGNSTKFAARAVRDLGLETELVSIDPRPRAEIDRLCRRTVRSPLEACDLSLFNELEAGDVLYVDNSHRAFQNSDVTVFFLEVLPRLAAGVLVGLDDIRLPYDYPPEWRFRYYSEQYLLACYLLAGGNRLRLVLPGSFVSEDEELAGILCRSPALARLDPRGDCFWFETH
jgi:hypothetical protein